MNISQTIIPEQGGAGAETNTLPTQADRTSVTIDGVTFTQSGNEWPTIARCSTGVGFIESGPGHHGLI